MCSLCFLQQYPTGSAKHISGSMSFTTEHTVSENNLQYLSKIEQAHYKTLFLVSSKSRDEVRPFANHNKTNDRQLPNNTDTIS